MVEQSLTCRVSLGLSWGTQGHDTAVALRMAGLQSRFPGALMFGVVEGGNGADLTCWGCDPGKVWVWEFKSLNERKDVGETSLAKGMASAKASALTGDMVVVAGPDFGPMMGVPIQTKSSMALDGRMVTVSDSQKGVQRYWTDEQDDEDEQVADNTRNWEWAKGVATRYNSRAKAAGHVQPGPSHGSKGPKPTSNPPKPPKAAAHATNHSTNSPGLGRQQRPSDGVRGGSFWGDVALFAGAIFAVLVAYAATEAAMVAAAAA